MKETGFGRVSKNLIIAQIKKELEGSPAFFITKYAGISSGSLDKLRTKLRGADSRYFVIKNSLGRKALASKKFSPLADEMTGACGIAFSDGDPAVSSKILMEFSKTNEGFKVHSGFVDEAVIGVDQVKVLASLPPKEVLIARVVGGVQAPISRFVRVLSGAVRRVVTVLDAIAKKKSSGTGS
ncbi:MAG: 50S ribosomal protein L10 [Candidatus Omnitrophica bacterium CG1_02_49_16]|nr:MAG: 50S ribosomal protein L10 [Candidatus Omnitrophica bacterium CG1_02_49_16]